MAGTFPSWQTTLIVKATHWHADEAGPPRAAVATVHLRARDDGAVMATISNGGPAAHVEWLTAEEAVVLARVLDPIFSRQQVKP